MLLQCCCALWIFAANADSLVKIAALGGIVDVLKAMRIHTSYLEVCKLVVVPLRVSPAMLTIWSRLLH